MATETVQNTSTKKKNKKKIKYPIIDWLSFGIEMAAGVDEVGRGCLAGPVYAAAVILRPDDAVPFRIEGLTDSKLILPHVREVLAEEIKSKALCWSLAWAEADEIDAINILQASLLAMRRAVGKLVQRPELVLIDGNQLMGGPWNQKAIVKGDLVCRPISAASVLAKVARDHFMESLDEVYPGYDFKEHKGYPTPEHREAIRRLGPCPIHRKTFAGVKEFSITQEALVQI